MCVRTNGEPSQSSRLTPQPYRNRTPTLYTPTRGPHASHTAALPAGYRALPQPSPRECRRKQGVRRVPAFNPNPNPNPNPNLTLTTGTPPQSSSPSGASVTSTPSCGTKRSSSMQGGARRSAAEQGGSSGDSTGDSSKPAVFVARAECPRPRLTSAAEGRCTHARHELRPKP